MAECLSRGGLWVEVFCFVAADDVDEAVYIFSAGQHALVGVVGVNQQAAAAHVGVEGVAAVHLVGLCGSWGQVVLEIAEGVAEDDDLRVVHFYLPEQDGAPSFV